MTVSQQEVNDACEALRIGLRPPDPHYVAAMLESQQATIVRLTQLLDLAGQLVNAADKAIYSQHTMHDDCPACAGERAYKKLKVKKT
jgi:hypothetical protein